MKTNIKTLSRIALSYFSMLVLTAFTFNLPGDCQGDKASTKPIYNKKKKPCSDNQEEKNYDTSYSKTPKTNPSTDIEKEAKTTESGLPTSKDQSLHTDQGDIYTQPYDDKKDEQNTQNTPISSINLNKEASQDIKNADKNSIIDNSLLNLKNSERKQKKILESVVDNSLKCLIKNLYDIENLKKFDFLTYFTEAQDEINKVIKLLNESSQATSLLEKQNEQLNSLIQKFREVDMDFRRFCSSPIITCFLGIPHLKRPEKLKKSLKSIKKEAKELYKAVFKKNK